MRRKRLPNPGSKDAIRAGCICPIEENLYGRGYGYDEKGRKVFVVEEDCPIHKDVRKKTKEKKEKKIGGESEEKRNVGRV